MNRRGAASAATLAVALVAPAQAGAQGNELAVGSAKNRLADVAGPVQLEVSAHRRPDGTISGHVRGSGDLFAPFPGGDFRTQGPVTCLRIEPKPDGSGFRASIKYSFKNTRGSLAPPEGGGVEVYIEDNGNPARGQAVDANGTGPPQPAELFDPLADQCSDPNLAGQPFNPVDQGNYTIRATG